MEFRLIILLVISRKAKYTDVNQTKILTTESNKLKAVKFLHSIIIINEQFINLFTWILVKEGNETRYDLRSTTISEKYAIYKEISLSSRLEASWFLDSLLIRTDD